MRRIGAVGAMLTMLLALSAGCGDGGNDDDASDDAAEDTAATSGEEGASDDDAPDADGCLITLAEVNEVTGLDMVPIDGTDCGYEIPLDPNSLENPENAGAQVFYRPTSPNAIEAFLVDGEAVDGLGDEAAYDEFAGSLVVAKGDFTFELQLIEVPGDAKAHAVDLAEIVLTKL